MSKNGLKAKKALLTKRAKRQELSTELLSTGSTLLNLACSGKTSGGIPKGTIVLVVGDSDSGKTFITLTSFAEACLSKRFEDYRLIFDGPEYGALMDMGKFFGEQTVERIEQPTEEGPSRTLDEFYYNVDDAIEDGRPFIYLLDSIDGIEPEEDEAKFKEDKKKARANKEKGGTYGVTAAKLNSRRLRSISNKLPKSGSILILICQSRDSLGFGFGDKKTRAGGRALKFYSSIEIWLSVLKQLSTKVNGKDRQLGILSKVQVKRSRVTGKHRTVTVPIYHSYGIDDLGSCLDFLVEEGKIGKGNKGRIKAFGQVLSREKMIRYVERKHLQRELRDLVKETWYDIESKCELRRERRYE